MYTNNKEKPFILLIISDFNSSILYNISIVVNLLTFSSISSKVKKCETPILNCFGF